MPHEDGLSGLSGGLLNILHQNRGHVWGSFGIDWGDYGSCGDHRVGLLLLGRRLSSLLDIHLVVGL